MLPDMTYHPTMLELRFFRHHPVLPLLRYRLDVIVEDVLCARSCKQPRVSTYYAAPDAFARLINALHLASR